MDKIEREREERLVEVLPASSRNSLVGCSGQR